MVSNTSKSPHYHVLTQLDQPRYTYQGGLVSTGFFAEDGLWCSYHFLPGNFDCPNTTSTKIKTHGDDIAKNYLPKFEKRNTNAGQNILEKKYTKHFEEDLLFGHLLSLPYIAFVLESIQDTLDCFYSDHRIKQILSFAKDGKHLIDNAHNHLIQRFKLILLGVRAHVRADTWRHQDFCGLPKLMNTY